MNMPSFCFPHNFLDDGKVEERLAAKKLKVDSTLPILFGKFRKEVVNLGVYLGRKRLMHQGMLQAVNTVHVARVPEHNKDRLYMAF